MASAKPCSSSSATVRVANALVVGKTEAILTTASGLPLYYYGADRSGTSLVSGQLAALWPPLTSAAPAVTGLSGKLTVVNDAHGGQLAYNGHLLYIFMYDRPGQVNGPWWACRPWGVTDQSMPLNERPAWATAMTARRSVESPVPFRAVWATTR